MARKYLRGLQYTTSTNGKDMSIFLRVCYEFWAYCVNGGSNPTTPGGLPATTPTSAPTNFFEGTTVLATGIDGVSSAIGTNFTSNSASFDVSMTGKHITIWHPRLNSTDDSIYRITRVISATQLVISPFSGGTPDISTLKNNITSRSGLRYRVFDVVAASQLAVASGNYFVGTLSGASGINVGQANSQFQILLRGSSPTFGQIGVVGSPAGTWNGTTFTGNNITERTTGTTTNLNVGGSGATGFITLIADTDFFIGHVKSSNTNTTSGLYFHITVPQRIYSQVQDPNLLTVLVGGNSLSASNATDSYSSSFGMVDFAGTTRSYQLITRNFVCDGYSFGPTYTIGPNLQNQLNFQLQKYKVIRSDALMSFSGVAGQFSFARARLRPTSFTGIAIPQYHLIGDNGQFIHMGNGILWPWDGTTLPYNLLPLGA